MKKLTSSVYTFADGQREVFDRGRHSHSPADT